MQMTYVRCHNCNFYHCFYALLIKKIDLFFVATIMLFSFLRVFTWDNVGRIRGTNPCLPAVPDPLRCCRQKSQAFLQGLCLCSSPLFSITQLPLIVPLPRTEAYSALATLRLSSHSTTRTSGASNVLQRVKSQLYPGCSAFNPTQVCVLISPWSSLSAQLLSSLLLLQRSACLVDAQYPISV